MIDPALDVGMNIMLTSINETSEILKNLYYFFLSLFRLSKSSAHASLSLLSQLRHQPAIGLLHDSLDDHLHVKDHPTSAHNLDHPPHILTH
jgi:hypothetical protein